MFPMSMTDRAEARLRDVDRGVERGGRGEANIRSASWLAMVWHYASHRADGGVTIDVCQPVVRSVRLLPVEAGTARPAPVGIGGDQIGCDCGAVAV
jgi:hypothetical protein